MTEILYKELSYAIVGAAMEVHRVLGPGFLEAVYEEALCIEFSTRDIPFARQKRLHVSYKGQIVGDYVADLVVDEKVIVELKAVDKIAPIHEAQLLTYEAEVFNQVLEELDASDSGSLEYLLQARQEQRHYQKLPGLWLIWRLRLRRWWRRFR